MAIIRGEDQRDQKENSVFESVKGKLGNNVSRKSGSIHPYIRSSQIIIKYKK